MQMLKMKDAEFLAELEKMEQEKKKKLKSGFAS